MNQPETRQTPNEIRVWDPLVRIFHWSLVTAFAVAWLSGDEESPLHVYSGYAVIGLVLIRIAWGFVGTRYARFSDFVYRPATILAYAKDLLAGKSKPYLGHNPLGGAMIIALLVSLLAAGITGLVLQGAQDGTGPFAALSASAMAIVPGAVASAVADDDQAAGENEGAEEIWKELHEFFANLALLLVVLHIAGVIIGSLVHRENLVRAMFTGRKSV